MKNNKNEYGLLPPQASELEDSVLGALMVESSAYDRVANLLHENIFYKESNKKIFAAIKTLASMSQPIDRLTVVDQLQKDGTLEQVGGSYQITLITMQIGSSAHLEFHAQVIAEKFVAREVIRISNKITEMAYDETTDIYDTLNFANENLKNLDISAEGGILNIIQSLELMIENIYKNSSENKGSSGTQIGFKKFDERSGGFQTSDFNVIAAESSQGKTSLALSMARNMAVNGSKIAIYSLEMKAMQVAARLTAMETGLPANVLLYSKFDKEMYEQLHGGIGRLTKSEIYIDEKSTSSLSSITASIRTMVKSYGVKGVFIDYIQLIHAGEKGMNKEQQTALIARTFKNLAKELDIWITALSQLSRDNTNPVPTIKRLRDSGQIEEAADVVILIYRPEHYGRKHIEEFENENPSGTAMIDIAKGRNIGTFKFVCRFDNKTTHFFDKPDFEQATINAVEKSRAFYDNPF